MDFRQDKEAGVTLIEALVALALLSIVGYFVFATQTKTQKMMFKGTSRDAHTQVISILKTKSGKTLEEILVAAKSNPVAIGPLLKSDLPLGENIRLTWAKPEDRRKDIRLQYSAKPDIVARETLQQCRKSVTSPRKWRNQELGQRLASQSLLFCGQLVLPPRADGPRNPQSLADANYAFVSFDVEFTRVLDGQPVTLAEFGTPGTLATVTWTLVWSYEKSLDTVQQFRKGVYHLVP